MPAKKISHLLHRRINELLDQILMREAAQQSSKREDDSEPSSLESNSFEANAFGTDASESMGKESDASQPEESQLNLGSADEQFLVSMESFFQFNFDLSSDIDQWIDEQIEENRLDGPLREWDQFLMNDENNRTFESSDDRFTSSLPKRPK